MTAYGAGTYGAGPYGVDAGPQPLPQNLDTVDEFPVVSVWRYDTGTRFVKVGRIPAYAALMFKPTYQDVGEWSLSAAYSVAKALVPGRLVTIDFRGKRSTWLINEFHPSQDGVAEPQVTVTGAGAVAMLGWCLAWPDATNDIVAQPIYLDTQPAPFVGAAEDILRFVAASNFRDRYGAPIRVAVSQGRGSRVKVRPKFDNLFELMQTHAKSGDIGFDIGLENIDATHADLWLRFIGPVDKSARVRLKSAPVGPGTIAAWDQADTAPTATHAVVSRGTSLGDAQTTLAADVTAGATTITVASSANFPTPGGDTPAFRVVIDDETMTVTKVAKKVWTVVRGVGVTSGGVHSQGDPVRLTRSYRWPISTVESRATAAAWGGAREVYVDGPDSSDRDEIDAAAYAAIRDGAETRTLSMTLSEAVGMRAFIHYDVSDIVSYEVLTGASGKASITSTEVTVGDDGITVKSTVGNPSGASSSLRLRQILRGLTRAVRRHDKD